MLLYHIAAALKTLVWAVIIRLVYQYIDPTLDPAMWLGFWFLGVFIATWGVSFYFFWGIQQLFSKKTPITCAKEGYKFSLLFGIYVLINIALLFLGQRNKLRGGILFVGFIALQIFLSLTPDTSLEYDKKEF